MERLALLGWSFLIYFVYDKVLKNGIQAKLECYFF